MFPDFRPFDKLKVLIETSSTAERSFMNIFDFIYTVQEKCIIAVK